jgi:hypothetical protein
MSVHPGVLVAEGAGVGLAGGVVGDGVSVAGGGRAGAVGEAAKACVSWAETVCAAAVP